MSLLHALRAVARTAQLSLQKTPTQSYATACGRLGAKTVETPPRDINYDNPIENILSNLLGKKQALQALSIAKIPPQFAVKNTTHTVNQAQLSWIIALGNALDVWQRSEHTRQYLRTHGPQKIDHFGIRTLDRTDFVSILQMLGYTKQPDLYFKEPSLVGSGFHHPEHGVDVPMYFLSEWQGHINNHSKDLQFTANWYEEHRYEPSDTYDAFKSLKKLQRTGSVDSGEAFQIAKTVLRLFKQNYHTYDHIRSNQGVTIDDYQQALSEGADALAWILTNGQHPNHLAITVNPEDFASVREELRQQHGEFLPTQLSKNGLLLQTANKAEKFNFVFRSGGTIHNAKVLGPFLEFCARLYDPSTNKPYTGFDANNARNIFNYSTVVNTPKTTTPETQAETPPIPSTCSGIDGIMANLAPPNSEGAKALEMALAEAKLSYQEQQRILSGTNEPYKNADS